MAQQVRFALPSFRSASTALAVAMLVTSILWKLAFDAGVALYLVPGQVLGGRVWQLASWVIASAPSTTSVIFNSLIMWSTGGTLELRWGKARFLRFVLATTLLAGVMTVVTSLIVPPIGSVAFYGGDVMVAVVWVGYGCVIWNQSTTFWGYPLTGKSFALIGVGFLVLNAIFSSPLLLLAEAWALLFTFAYARYGFPTEFLIRFRSWQMDRDLKKRASHLKGIDGGRRNVGGDSDKFLH
jgi:hypothetical protein